MSSTKKEDGSTKSFVEYKAELNTSDTRVAQIASAGASAVGGSRLDLGKNQKRWMVAGICLFKVVTPQLRKYVEQHMTTTYDNLKMSNNIDRQTFPTHLKNDGKHKFNYAAINNNQTGRTAGRYDYKVTSNVDMAKLYLQTYMAKFSAFDESCDPSAVLGILYAASCFSSTIQANGQDVRANVRNKWAHCNFADWDEAKFVLAFRKMEVLVRSLALPNNDTDDTVGQMNDWKDKGVLLCMGSPVDKDLLKVLYDEVSVLAKYSLDIHDDTQNKLKEICKKINSAIQNIEVRLVATEEEQKVMDDRIRQVDQDVKKNSDHLVTLENEQDALQEEQSMTKRKLGNLEEEHGCAMEDVKRLKLDQTCAEDKLQRLEAKQTETSAEMPKLKSQQNVLDIKQSNLETQVELVKKDVTGLEDKVQSLDNKLKDTNFSTMYQVCFQVPDRNEYFCGREHELREIEEAFAISNSSAPSNKVFGISGLGGCGKTTLAVEYSWRCCSYYTGGVFWLSAESENLFRKTVRQLASALNIRHGDFDQCLLETLNFLSQMQLPFLLVLDNADEPELSNNVRKFLSGHSMRKSKGHILVTTRRKAEELQEVTNVTDNDCITLGCYTQEEAITFIQKRTNMTHAASNQEFSMGSEDLNALTELVNELGRHPLALEQAGSHIRCLKCTYPQYLAEFTTRKLKLIQNKKAKASSEEMSKERLAVHTTWLMNFEYASKLAQESGLEELTSIVIDVSAYLSPDDIPCDIIKQAYCLSEPQDEARIEVTPVVVGEILDILTKFSLFQSTSRDSLSVHRLVQQVIQSRCSEERREEVLVCGVRMLDFAMSNTKSPANVLAEVSERTNPDDASIQEVHSLITWAKLASNAVTLKSHLMEYVKTHLEAGPRLLYSKETARVLWETAVYLSMSNQQPQAFQSQRIMLQILADINNEGRLTNQVSIPLTDDQRRVLHLCTKSTYHGNIPDTIPNTSVEESTQVMVDRLRLKGKEAYGKSDYESAVSIYTEAINISGIRTCRPDDLSTLYSNRSQCYLKLNKPADALRDAEECVRIDPHSCKAYFRRALAMKLLFEKGNEEYKLAYLASAVMAVNLDAGVMKEAERTFGPAICNTRIVSTQDQWRGVINEIRLSASTYSTHRQTELIILLQSGKYEFDLMDMIFPFLWRTIFIGVGDVEIKNARIIIGPGSSYHFENIVFDNPAITAIASFLSCVRCTFQNGAVHTFSECLEDPCYGCRICHPEAYVHEGDIPGGSGNLTAGMGSNLFVSWCILRNSAGGVLARDNGTSALVRYCKIHNHLQASVEVRDGASLVVEESELCNSVYGEGACLGKNAGQSRVSNNKIHGNKSWGIVVSQGSYEITIEGNEIYQNGKDGIKVMNSASMVARKNGIFENSFWGIDIDYGSSDEISKNMIHDNKCGGIRVNTSGRVVLVRNEVTDHDGPGILHSHRTMSEMTIFPIVEQILHTPPEIQNIEMQNARKMLEELGPSYYQQSPLIPPQMSQNVEMRNKEGEQYPKKNSISIGLRCAHCRKVQSDKVKLLNCTGCHGASYCNENCQRQHWKTHEHLCKDLKDKFSHVIDIPPTGLTTQRTFHSDLKGIKQAPKPYRSSRKRFIVKIQTLEELIINRYCALTLCDQSTDVNVDEFHNERIRNIIVQCGVLRRSKSTGKKIFCYASFEKKGKKLRIRLDELAPFQKW